MANRDITTPLAWGAGELAVGLAIAAVQPDPGPSPWYPALAVAIALLLLHGRRWWPLVLVVQAVVAAASYRSAGPALAAAVLTTAGAVAVAELLHRWRLDPQLPGPEDVLKLGVTASAGAATGAVAAVALLPLAGFDLLGRAALAQVWFVGRLTGVAVLLPLLLLVGSARSATSSRLGGLRGWATVELWVAATGGLVLVAWTFARLAVEPAGGGLTGVGPLLACLLPLLWVAIRFGRLRTAVLALAADVVGVVVLLVAYRTGDPVGDEQLVALQVFMLVAALASLLVASAVDAATAARDLQQAVFDASPVAITAVDLDRHVVLWNRAAEAIFGWRADEVLGRPPPIIPDDAAGDFRDRAAAQLEGPTERTLRYRRRDGSSIAATLSTSPLADGDGHAVGVVGIISDVTHELELEADLATERADRRTVADALAGLRRGPSAAATAGRLCRAAARVEGIRGAILCRPDPSGSPEAIGAALPAVLPGPDGPLTLLEGLLARHAGDTGPWSEELDPSAWDGGPLASMLAAVGVTAVGGAPVVWEGRTVAHLLCGTTRAAGGAHLAHRLPAFAEIANHAAALLGPQLAAEDALVAERSWADDVVANGRLRAVFQPVVELASGRVVGHEALTRFEDGCAPDLAIARAAAVGRGHGLELACVRTALESAVGLPPQHWVSLNVSPSLVLTGALAGVLEGVVRPVVLEVTEHEVVRDYAALRRALDALRGVRVSVDDAGAGYASLRHILELRPDVVKLDIGLVRGVDTDPARQAMVAGMRYFAQRTGTELLAEGVETAAEAAECRALGVTLGQGFLFGRPAPPELQAGSRSGWAAAST